MKNVNKIFWILFFLVMSAGSALAEEEQYSTAKEVQISPTRFDWQLKSGESRSGAINLKNYNMESDYRIVVDVEDFYVSDDSMQANFFVPDQSHPLKAYDVINWVVPQEKEFLLKKGEVKELPFTINVPADAPTGGYYGGIFVQHEKVQTEEEIDSSKVKINTRAGVLLILGVQGDDPISRNGKMERMETEKKIYFDKPAKFKAFVSNFGNLQYRMAGELQILRGDKVVEKIEAKPETIYPNKLRQFEMLWNFSLLDFGKYVAKVNLVSEDGEVAVSGEVSFWVIPWKTVAAGMGVLILLWGVYKMGGKKEKKKMRRA